MIGLERGTVRLEEHNDTWMTVAGEMCRHIKDALGTLAVDVAHVGSTSVPGLCAKPIIDLAVAVTDFSDEVICALESAGYMHVPSRDDEVQMLFSQGQGEWRSAHVHVVRYMSMEWRNYLNFKAYLIAFPAVCAQYAALKSELAQKYACDRESYTQGKAEFITYHLRKAMVWSYLGKQIDAEVDRPIGYVHVKGAKTLVYPVNYGYIPGVLGGDGEELDVYFLGVDQPLERFSGKVIAIAHRADDVEDKLIACPMHTKLSPEQVCRGIYFQEKYYNTTIEMLDGRLYCVSNGEKNDC